MPKLTCEVVNCNNNRSSMCCDESVKVGGVKASTSASTSCESFVKATASLTNNSMQSATENHHICCEAGQCVNNCNGGCNAESVNINGSLASSTQGTECSSFVPKM